LSKWLNNIKLTIKNGEMDMADKKGSDKINSAKTIQSKDAYHLSSPIYNCIVGSKTIQRHNGVLVVLSK
jgi:hypothetical protein